MIVEFVAGSAHMLAHRLAAASKGSMPWTLVALPPIFNGHVPSLRRACLGIIIRIQRLEEFCSPIASFVAAGLSAQHVIELVVV